MYFVYILYSLDYNCYYIGQTKDLSKEVSLHYHGHIEATKAFKPWKLRHYEIYDTRREAIFRENYLNSLKSNDAIEKVINNNTQDSSQNSSWF